MVPFLQDHYCVLRVVVRKMNLDVVPIQSPSQAPLRQAPEPPQTFRERDPVILGLPPRGRGGGLPLVPPSHTMIDMVVRQ